MGNTPNLTKEMLHNLADDLMFKISDEQCANLLLEFEAIEQQMTIVTKIKTNNVEPLNYPLPIINSYLRNDVIQTPLTSKAVLDVAPQVDNDYIVINQVINHGN